MALMDHPISQATRYHRSKKGKNYNSVQFRLSGKSSVFKELFNRKDMSFLNKLKFPLNFI
jgi:hypothetical protein